MHYKVLEYAYCIILKGGKMGILKNIKEHTKKEAVNNYSVSDVNKIVTLLLNANSVKIRNKPKMGEQCVPSVDLITGKLVYQCTVDKK